MWKTLQKMRKKGKPLAPRARPCRPGARKKNPNDAEEKRTRRSFVSPGDK